MSKDSTAHFRGISVFHSTESFSRDVKDAPDAMSFGISKEKLICIIKAYIHRESNDDIETMVELLGAHDQAMNRLCQMLKTEMMSGLNTLDADLIQSRQRIFGRNKINLWESSPFSAFVIQASQDALLRILMVCGFTSIVLSIFFGEPHSLEWIDGVVIFMAVVIVILVTATNDYFREQQFRSLYEKKLNFCLVVRNRNHQKIEVENLMVGDIMMVESGDEVPVDCLVLTSYQFAVDESSMTGESSSVNKMSLEQCQTKFEAARPQEGCPKAPVVFFKQDLPSPVVLAGSIVLRGTAKLLVVAVGVNCQAGGLTEKLIMDTESTPLKMKLNHVGQVIGKIGMFCGSVIFLIHIIQFWLVYFLHNDRSQPLIWTQVISCHVEAMIQSITLLVVSVPEGLPLAVTLALAYSVNRMYEDKSYVRNLAACETIGEASDICLDKTGTITENLLSVKGVWNGCTLLLDDTSRCFGLRDIVLGDTLESQNYRNLCIESILCNSTAYYDGCKGGRQTKDRFVGCSTECALLAFLEILFRMPFDSARKVMFTVVKLRRNAQCRVYVKGAAEILLDFCEECMHGDGSCSRLDETVRTRVKLDVIQTMGRYGLRTLCLAYKDVETEDAEEINFESDLRCLLIVGLRDSLREGVALAVDQCQVANIHVRMITGDNIDTAKRIGQECNIYRPHKGSVALTGKEFYERVGGVVCVWCKTEVCDCLPHGKACEGEPNQESRPSGVGPSRDGQLKDRSPSEASLCFWSILLYPVHLCAMLSRSVWKMLRTLRGVWVGVDNSSKQVPWMKPQEKIDSVGVSEDWETCAREPLKGFRERSVRVDTLGNMEAFESLVGRLDILARAHPRDKYAFVVGLKMLGGVVAVTGDGANDALALKKADVGLAMGLSGKEIAKRAADIILLDDQFSSIVKAVIWGRNIYDNICRFIKFQLVVNASTLVISLGSSFIFGECPFNTAQLLWVNLIMDTFASLALATEAPTLDAMKQFPRKRDAPLIDPEMIVDVMWRVMYQMLVMSVLIFSGECWIPEESSISYQRFEGQDGFSQFSQRCGNGRTVAPGYRYAPFSKNQEVYSRHFRLMIGPSRHYTMVYNTFVFLQIFSLISARKRSSFQCKNWQECRAVFTWGILIFTICVIQYSFIQYGGVALESHLDGLTLQQWGLCLVLSFSMILFEVCLYLIKKMSRTPLSKRFGVSCCLSAVHHPWCCIWFRRQPFTDPALRVGQQDTYRTTAHKRSQGKLRQKGTEDSTPWDVPYQRLSEGNSPGLSVAL